MLEIANVFEQDRRFAPTIAVAARAVLNATFNATGQRVRDLLLKDTVLRA